MTKPKTRHSNYLSRTRGAVQNILAATTQNPPAVNRVYNVGVGDQTTLNDLYFELRRLLAPRVPALAERPPRYRAFREGDVRHSRADVSKAKLLLGYEPSQRFAEGLAQTVQSAVRRQSIGTDETVVTTGEE